MSEETLNVNDLLYLFAREVSGIDEPYSIEDRKTWVKIGRHGVDQHLEIMCHGDQVSCKAIETLRADDGRSYSSRAWNPQQIGSIYDTDLLNKLKAAIKNFVENGPKPWKNPNAPSLGPMTRKQRKQARKKEKHGQ